MISERNKRIANNTLMLYFRHLLILFVSLYTVRIVLDQLGVEDYGIYVAVGGLVALSAFLPGSLAQATQRFFSYALGERNHKRLKTTFSINLILYFSVALIALLVLKTIGFWFVENYLSVPEDRFESAKILFHYSALTFVVSILTTPFVAIIMAHEDMKLYASVSIVEALMKLVMVFVLRYVTWDKLELYGFLVLCVAIVNALIYISICFYRYDECQVRKLYWDPLMLQEIIGFTGWTVFGQITNVARTHAITLLLNQSFNPVVVAARAVSVQVATKANIFSNNFNISLYPPIIKSYAADQKEEMLSLVIGGSKVTFYLLWVLALPMIAQMETILGLWLTTIPEGAVLFTQLSMIEALILAVSLPLTIAARAPGKMKTYELTLGTIQLALFFVAWFTVSQGGPAYSVFVVAILANVVMFFVRLGLLKSMIDFPIMRYIRFAILPLLLVVILSALPVYYLTKYFSLGFLGLMLVTSVSAFWTTLVMYRVGLDKTWRNIVKNKISSKVFNRPLIK